MVTGTLEGNALQDSWQKLESQYWNALKANYYVWPAIQIVNFYLVPMHYQSILVNSVSVIWNAYLSQLNQRGQDAMLAAKKIESNP
jgi:protein Mpv17